MAPRPHGAIGWCDGAGPKARDTGAAAWGRGGGFRVAPGAGQSDADAGYPEARETGDASNTCRGITARDAEAATSEDGQTKTRDRGVPNE